MSKNKNTLPLQEKQKCSGNEILCNICTLVIFFIEQGYRFFFYLEPTNQHDCVG